MTEGTPSGIVFGLDRRDGVTVSDRSGRTSSTQGILAGIGVVSGALAVAAVATAAATSMRFAREIVAPRWRNEDDLQVLGVDTAAATVTLSSQADSLLPGVYGLWFSRDSGYAVVGEILATTQTSVTRRLVRVLFGELDHARRARMSGWVHLSPDELGFDYETVLVRTPVGLAPAWRIPAATETGRWVIQVHGRGVTRAEALRTVPTFRELGFTSLLVSYRNDGDAPASDDGRCGLGDFEWRDVEAAVQYALDNDAHEVVLMGWSMGGTAVLQVLKRSTLAGQIAGVILDSPVVDWPATLMYASDTRGLPAPLREGALALVTRPWGRPITGQKQPIDFGRLDVIDWSAKLTTPTLILHSDDDRFVPSGASRELAALRPDAVTLVPFDTAGHTRLWNYDPERWTAAIVGWLVEQNLVDQPE